MSFLLAEKDTSLFTWALIAISSHQPIYFIFRSHFSELCPTKWGMPLHGKTRVHTQEIRCCCEPSAQWNFCRMYSNKLLNVSQTVVHKSIWVCSMQSRWLQKKWSQGAHPIETDKNAATVRKIGHGLPKCNGYYANQSACGFSLLNIPPFKPEAAKQVDSGECSPQTVPATDRLLFRIVYDAAMLLALTGKWIPHVTRFFINVFFTWKICLSSPKTVFRIVTSKES